MSVPFAGHGLIAEPGRASKTDGWLILSSLLLMASGFLAIYSVDAARTGTTYMAKQMIFAAMGIGVFFACSKIDLSWWRKAATPLYIFNLMLLAATLLFLKKKNGSSRWIEIGPIQFQPSELSKILICITLMAFFVNREDELGEFKTIALSFLHIVPPMILLIMQPHYGGAACFFVAWLTMVVYARVPWRTLAIIFVSIAAMGGLALSNDTVASKVFKGYQLRRIKGMSAADPNAPEADKASIQKSQATTYQQRMAAIAIGAGGWGGQGYLKGEQKRSGYIPEQQTDFIFSVVGEEGGLVGSMLILALYAFFFYRVWLVAFSAQTFQGRLVAAGLMSILALHTIVNLAMVLKIGPVIGLWLPFMSYGGTALWMCMAAVGFLNQAK